MARQWISIEKAAAKYQISGGRIYNWCCKRKVTFSEIDNDLFIDENSLMECLDRNIRFSLEQNELNRHMEEKLQASKENLFLLQSLKELTPIIRILIEELSLLIRSDERREFFRFIALEGSLKEYAVNNHKSQREAQDLFQGLVLEIRKQAKFIRDYKEVNIFLKARLKSYEIQESKKGTDNAAEKVTLTENIVALLNTSICELGFTMRVQRALAPTDIDTLRDLLLIIRARGFRILSVLKGIGKISQMEIENRLRELNILDDQGNCDLYKYLGE